MLRVPPKRLTLVVFVAVYCEFVCLEVRTRKTIRTGRLGCMPHFYIDKAYIACWEGEESVVIRVRLLEHQVLIDHNKIQPLVDEL